MNNTSRPRVRITSAPKFTIPLFVKTSQSRLSLSFGSGLCSQSSFSTSSGNKSSPADGVMLNFSETVCVLRSSSLPARDGALESSKGEANGPYLESRLPTESVSQLDLRDKAEAGDSSRKGRVLDFLGGKRCSAEAATVSILYNEGTEGDRRPGLAGEGAVPGRIGAVKERAEFWRAVLGRGAGEDSTMSEVPELRRMCGFDRGDSGDAMASECIGVGMLFGGYGEVARACDGLLV